MNLHALELDFRFLTDGISKRILGSNVSAGALSVLPKGLAEHGGQLPAPFDNYSCVIRKHHEAWYSMELHGSLLAPPTPEQKALWPACLYFGLLCVNPLSSQAAWHSLERAYLLVTDEWTRFESKSFDWADNVPLSPWCAFIGSPFQDHFSPGEQEFQREILICFAFQTLTHDTST